MCKEHPFLLDDGVHWVRLSQFEVEALETMGHICACTGDCAPDTYHPIGSWSAIDQVLEQLRPQAGKEN
jgi:hypothetical protein